jgi:hypothetical protein
MNLVIGIKTRTHHKSALDLTGGVFDQLQLWVKMYQNWLVTSCSQEGQEEYSVTLTGHILLRSYTERTRPC